MEIKESVIVHVDRRYRGWCPTCGDWKIFSYKNDLYVEVGHTHGSLAEAGFIQTCETCGSPKQNTKLSEIPDEKITEQRRRYRQHKRFLWNSSIIESDAGYKAYCEYQNRQWEKYHEKKAELLKYKQDHCKGVQRNDPCPCGSGLKYKKCHEPILKMYNI